MPSASCGPTAACSGLILVIAFFAVVGVVSAVPLTARPVTARASAAPVGPQETAELIKTIEAERGAVSVAVQPRASLA